MGVGRSKKCVHHGGGKRCIEPMCDKSAAGGSSLCKKHGGGRRCVYRDPAKYNPNNKVGKCTRSAQGSTHYCKQHGGGLRCKFPTCSKVAIGKNPQMCRHHGGAKGTRIPMPPPILPDQEGNYPKADIVAAITQAAVGKAAQVEAAAIARMRPPANKQLASGSGYAGSHTHKSTANGEPCGRGHTGLREDPNVSASMVVTMASERKDKSSLIGAFPYAVCLSEIAALGKDKGKGKAVGVQTKRSRFTYSTDKHGEASENERAGDDNNPWRRSTRPRNR